MEYPPNPAGNKGQRLNRALPRKLRKLANQKPTPCDWGLFTGFFQLFWKLPITAEQWSLPPCNLVIFGIPILNYTTSHRVNTDRESWLSFFIGRGVYQYLLDKNMSEKN